jgi:hypothetical protein
LFGFRNSTPLHSSRRTQCAERQRSKISSGGRKDDRVEETQNHDGRKRTNEGDFSGRLVANLGIDNREVRADC